MGMGHEWFAVSLIMIMMISAFIPTRIQSLRFDIESGHTKCIYEEIKSGAMSVCKYRVVNPNAGDPLPETHNITVWVTSPNGNNYQYAEKVGEGEFVYETVEEAGDYDTCFFAPRHHPPVTLTVDFHWKSGVAATKDWTNVAKKYSIDAMELELKKMYETVNAIHDEMSYLREREEEMQELNRATNTEMGWLSGVSFILCLTVAGIQFLYLKTFFHKKKLF
ncbi:hypothetical protein DM860_008247 [Cuscuta australis]|uniref:GOLD domain-containing protein n=1 Tax=Cuscuta australis TaxID=267555 RepID=A0A328D2S8_9ASTE|nr:hypothetical protein DM860_008247 [Cuscuta australis]